MARSHARRQSAAETRAVPFACLSAARSAGSRSVPSGALRYPVIPVQAVTHCWNGTQSLLPLPHWASGVFQNSIVLKYDSGALAW